MAEDSKKKEKKVSPSKKGRTTGTKEKKAASGSGKVVESSPLLQLVDLNSLALALSMSVPTLRARIREGMPCVEEGGRGKSWQFDLAECVRWNTQREVNRSAAVLDDGMTKAQLEMEALRLKVQRERLEVAKLTGEVAPLDEVERALSTTFVEVRQAMLSIPDRVGGRVLACDDVISVKELLEGEIDAALSGMCEQDLLNEVVDE